MGVTNVIPSLVVLAASLGGSTHIRHYEYVFPDRHAYVYDIDHGHRLVTHWAIPAAHSLRGVAFSPRTGTLYFSVGGNGGSSGHGALVAYDLAHRRVLWTRPFPTGTDSLAVTPDGRTLYVPMGERTMGDIWYVVDARSGRIRAEIRAGPGPHNTIVSPDGRFVYLGPRNSRYLFIASTRTNRIVRRVGPLLPGVRPFTVDERRGLVYTTATGFLGFQVSSLTSGRVLETVPIRGFAGGGPTGTPCHGITLTPDGRRLFVIDVRAASVHAYAVGDGRPPRHLADIPLDRPMTGMEQPCGGDCGRAGWLQASLDGRYVYVGDDGDVISVPKLRVVGFLPALRNSRYQLELDWSGGRPIRTSTRSGIAYTR
jgi:DNA-binding beta-propeller fold protein YncE